MSNLKCSYCLFADKSSASLLSLEIKTMGTSCFQKNVEWQGLLCVTTRMFGVKIRKL